MKKYLNFAYRTTQRGSVELVMALIDLSNSMLSDDWPPSRKAAATRANIELVQVKAQQHPDDIVGIIGFGTDAKVLHPPVCLREGAGSLCRALDNLPSMGETNFKAALELAELCLFGKSGSKAALPGKGISGFLSWLLYNQHPASNYIRQNLPSGDCIWRIILLTDGDYNEGGSPLNFASRLKDAGVVIDCIGIGGSPGEVKLEKIEEVASRNPDGSLRYCWIGDQQKLIKKFQSLAHHIRPA